MIRALRRPRSLRKQLLYSISRDWHRTTHWFRQPNSLAEIHRLSADHVCRRERPAESGQTGQHGDWVHSMRVIASVSRGKILRVDGQRRNLARTPSSRKRINENQRRITVKQVVAQMQPADSIVDQVYVGRQYGLPRCLQVPNDLRTESVVAEEHIANASD
jgi:hypothetical protein